MMSAERESGAVLVDPLGGLALEPSNELKFKGPFDDYVTVSLTIRNPTEKRIAFKIKTTAPKRYCVKPNSGVLDPAQSMKVNVLLQPFNYDPNEKNKHKFMVQYMYLNETEMNLTVNDILNMWKDVPPTRLLDLKLKCIFEFTEAEQQRFAQLNQQQAATTGSNDSRVASASIADNSVYSTASSQQPTVSSSSSVKSTSSSNSAKLASPPATFTAQSLNQQPDSADNDFNSYSKVNRTANSSANTTLAAPSPPAGAKLDKNDNLVNELKLVKQENEGLKKEVARLKEEETRLRKLALQSPSSSSRTNETGSLDDLLNNRLVILVFVLIAVIVYLLLFR